MMTFLPFADFALSAACLDMRRLQNQRTEARFVLEWLEQTGFDLSDYGAARMWVGFRDALATYYNTMLAEYENRGKTNGPTLPRATVPASVAMPPWLGDERFHSSHRAVLLQKDAGHYGTFGWAEAIEAEFNEYLYPHKMDDGRWGLYPQSKYKKRTIVALAHGDRIDEVQQDGRCRKRKADEAAREKTTAAAADEESTPLAEVAAVPTTTSVLMATSAARTARPSSSSTPSSTTASEQQQHAELTAEYLQLTKAELPRLAKAGKFPIRFDHCFQRVALDYAFHGCWYDHLDRKKGPAIKQISTGALARAVAACRRMVAEGVEAVNELDALSLRWRGKQPKRAKAK